MLVLCLFVVECLYATNCDNIELTNGRIETIELTVGVLDLESRHASNNRARDAAQQIGEMK